MPPMTPKEIEAYWANAAQQFSPLLPVGQAISYPFVDVGNKVMAGLAGKRKGVSRVKAFASPPSPSASSFKNPAAPVPLPVPAPSPDPREIPKNSATVQLYGSTPAQAQQNLQENRAFNRLLRPTMNEGPPERSWMRDTRNSSPLAQPSLLQQTLAPLFYPYEMPSTHQSNPQNFSQKKPTTGAKAAASKKEDPNKPHSYTNADYLKWAKKYGGPGATSTTIGPDPGSKEREAAKATAEGSAASTQALYQYLFLVDTLRKIDSDPQMAANMDPTARQALRAMVQAQSQQMLQKAIGAGNAARLTELQQMRSTANPRGGWTGNAAPGAAAAYMQQQYLPQMAAQHQAALQYIQQNPTALPNGMSPDAYVNLSTDAMNAVQSMGAKAPAPKSNTAQPLPSPVPNVAPGSLDTGFLSQAQGFSPFDNTTPYAAVTPENPYNTNPYVAAYTV